MKHVITEQLMLIFGVNEQQICIACCKDTINITTCCHAPVCKSCYLEWLKHKRQCMHCKVDQCAFQGWVNNYRVEPEFNPHEYIHDLLHETPDIADAYNIGFTITDLFNVIQQNNYDMSLNPLMSMEELINYPEENEAFELQFGFTTTPVDQYGNSTGSGITVTQTLDYSGLNNEV